MERLANFKKNVINLKNKTNYGENKICEDIEKVKNDFVEYMDDDLNTSGALSVIFDMIKEVNNKIAKENNFSIKSIEKVLKLFDDLTQILGFKFESQDITEEIKSLLEKREFYRKNKNWEEADRIRDLLKSKGYNVQDEKIAKN